MLGRIQNMVWRITLILLGLSLSIAACGGKEDSETNPPPVPSSESAVQDGTALVQAQCTLCHNTERIDAARHDKAGWERTIARMIKTGARLTDAERKAVIDYLAGR
jgi:cytochrome c5